MSRIWPIETADIKIPYFNKSEIPTMSVKTVENHLSQVKTNKAATKHGIPAKIENQFSKETLYINNACIKTEAWPEIFKCEIVTP